MKLPSISVGIDLVEISEVARSLEKLGEAYAKRIFTDDEIKYCSTSPSLAPSRFAARFAAKEAALKALRLWDRGLDFRHIEVRRNPGGGTDLALHGAAVTWAETAGWTSWAVSMSHEGNYAIAMVVAQVAGASR
jgi:holo-[acyl-carrier protein] synthase